MTLRTLSQTEGHNLLMHYEISLGSHNQQEEKKKQARIEKKDHISHVGNFFCVNLFRRVDM